MQYSLQASIKRRRFSNRSPRRYAAIDDEPTLCMLVADVLEEAGYKVLQAGTGLEGLRVLQSNARIELLITDVGLPGV